VARTINDRNEGLFKEILDKLDGLIAMLLNFQTPPETMGRLVLDNWSSQDRMEFFNKIKMELPKYNGKDNRLAIIWVNKMEGIFASNPLACM